MRTMAPSNHNRYWLGSLVGGPGKHTPSILLKIFFRRRICSGPAGVLLYSSSGLLSDIIIRNNLRRGFRRA